MYGSFDGRMKLSVRCSTGHYRNFMVFEWQRILIEPLKRWNLRQFVHTSSIYKHLQKVKAGTRNFKAPKVTSLEDSSNNEPVEIRSGAYLSISMSGPNILSSYVKVEDVQCTHEMYIQRKRHCLVTRSE